MITITWTNVSKKTDHDGTVTLELCLAFAELKDLKVVEDENPPCKCCGFRRDSVSVDRRADAVLTLRDVRNDLTDKLLEDVVRGVIERIHSHVFVFNPSNHAVFSKFDSRRVMETVLGSLCGMYKDSTLVSNEKVEDVTYIPFNTGNKTKEWNEWIKELLLK